MNSAVKYFASIALLGVACGPPGLQLESSTDAGSTMNDSTSDSTTSESSTSESSTTESDTSEPDTSLESDGPPPTFVPVMDLYDDTVDFCDPFAQDCPEGEKCVPYGSTGGNWDSSKCVAVQGDQAPGEPCTYGGTVEATDDCDATGMCWDVMDIDGEPIGTCHAFCTGTAETPECPEASQCLDDFINVCISTCDPTLQDCSENLGCYWANNGFNCIITTQDIPSGEPCGFINDCTAGNGCLIAEVLPNCAGSACCSPWCTVGAGDQICEVLPGTTCVPFFEEGLAPSGYDHVGVCILPGS